MTLIISRYVDVNGNPVPGVLARVNPRWGGGLQRWTDAKGERNAEIDTNVFSVDAAVGSDRTGDPTLDGWIFLPEKTIGVDLNNIIATKDPRGIDIANIPVTSDPQTIVLVLQNTNLPMPIIPQPSQVEVQHTDIVTRFVDASPPDAVQEFVYPVQEFVYPPQQTVTITQLPATTPKAAAVVVALGGIALAWILFKKGRK